MATDRNEYIARNSEYNYNEDLVSFSLVDESTVRKLQKDGKVVLPQKKIDIPKDMRWNEKQMGSKLMQGIQNGYSIPKIANSLLEVIGNNKASATRNARTMTTSAENGGRLDSYKDLQARGVVQKKKWMATPDDRTRKSHIDIDGEEQDIDAEFSNGCMYPADGHGPSEEVWNCRCSMHTHIIGFRRADGSISRVNYDRDKTMHDTQMAAERKERGIDEVMQKVGPEITKPVIEFTPATTIAEAEEYARQNFVVENNWAGEGTVSYKGISLENANAINEEFTKLFAENELPRLRNIGVMNFRQNIWKDSKDAPMAYRAMFDGEIFFNPTILKNAKSLDAYIKKGQEAFDFCINNMDKFSGKQLDMVKLYAKAGRQTIAETTDNPIKAMLDHEVGHHIDHQILMKNKDFVEVTKTGMDEYGIKLSGYALHTRGEYVAESFCAYINGVDGVDPALAKIFSKEVQR
jgi:hypothetical protein